MLSARAAQTAALYSASARLTKARGPEDFARLAREVVKPPLQLAIVDMSGKVVACTPDHPAAGKTLAIDVGIFADIRSRGQHVRIGHDGVLLWAPLGSRAHWKRWFRSPHFRHWRQRRREHRFSAPGDGGPGGPSWREARRAFRRRAFLDNSRLLRLTVPTEAASAVLAPARRLMLLGGVVSLSLLVAGVLLWRALRRAVVAERELTHKQNLARLGGMAAVMAHEIRTPLAAIKGNAQLVGEQRPGDPKVEAIVSESSRLERLVESLLNYARPRAPVRTTVDPDEIVERAAEIVAPRALEAKVDLMCDVVGSGPCLSADPDQLLQLLVNLMQNAVEASESAATQAGADAAPEPVVVRARKRLSRVTFEVLDRGPGLDDVTMARIFEPFYTTRAKGTGLGLAVAFQITEQHGGRITLERRDGGGTVARVVLPTQGAAS
ncbi:MAG: hypothetical protein KC503_29840 [Myxococcales bacterium]|nr:hypothetical protein [Myxococcales bacterium]